MWRSRVLPTVVEGWVLDEVPPREPQFLTQVQVLLLEQGDLPLQRRDGLGREGG